MRFEMRAMILVAAGLLAACGEQQPYSQGLGQGGGEVTGIVINTQQPTPQTPPFDSQRRVGWQILDLSGGVVFQKTDITSTVNAERTIYKRVEIEEGGSLNPGPNPLEVSILNREVETVPPAAEGKPEGLIFKFTISDADAARLRAVPNLNKIVADGNITFLVGKLGG